MPQQKRVCGLGCILVLGACQAGSPADRQQTTRGADGVKGIALGNKALDSSPATWRITAGGPSPFTDSSSEAQLRQTYGDTLLESVRIELGEGETAPGSALYPADRDPLARHAGAKGARAPDSARQPQPLAGRARNLAGHQPQGSGAAQRQAFYSGRVRLGLRRSCTRLEGRRSGLQPGRDQAVPQGEETLGVSLGNGRRRRCADNSRYAWMSSAMIRTCALTDIGRVYVGGSAP